jgi:hypothetical protein
MNLVTLVVFHCKLLQKKKISEKLKIGQSNIKYQFYLLTLKISKHISPT